jgi:hypothetical protein
MTDLNLNQNVDSQNKKTGCFVWGLRILFLPFWLLFEITKWSIKSIKKGGNQRIFGIVAITASYGIALLVLISFFSYTSSPEYKANKTATSVAMATTEEFKVGISLTETAKPTETPIPTQTSEPTKTKAPTLTPTQPPAPQTFQGSGDDVVEVMPVGPAILDITYSGGSNFIVQNFDANGNQIGLLVNSIGSYKGRLELDFKDGEMTSMIQIQSSGDWTMTITPLQPDVLQSINNPGTYQGSGDDVILVIGDPKKATFNRQGESNFIVFAYGNSVSLLVNEIGPYTGTVLIPNGTFILVVKSSGEWTVETN